jgi:two-component sensor histidine kinase
MLVAQSTPVSRTDCATLLLPQSEALSPLAHLELSLPGQQRRACQPQFKPEFVLSQFASGKHGEMVFSSEAAHRAKNLAQLAHNVIHLRLAQGSKEIEAAFALAQAYAEIGNAGDCVVAVPSKNLLVQVVSSLVSLFGRGDRMVALHARADELLMAPDRRRLLVLIASELVINALKHAFRGRRTGLIDVCLHVDKGQAHLMIAIRLGENRRAIHIFRQGTVSGITCTEHKRNAALV